MRVPVDQDSIIGNFLPNVFIERITLESSGHPNLHNLDDPHIKTEGNPEFARFRSENRLATGEKGDEKLKVTIDLVIKERVENTKDLVMSWLQQIDFQKFVKIQVMQSTDAAVTKVLAAGNSMLGMLTRPGWYNTVAFLSAYNLAFPNREVTAAEIRERFRSIESRRIDFSSQRQPLTRSGKASHSENVWQDMDGNTYQDIPFAVTFLIEEVSPRHLAYCVAATLDVKAIIDAYDLRPDAPVAANGVVSLDVVIDGGTATEPGRVVSDAYVTYDKDGNIWAGVTHVTPDGALRAGHPPADGEKDNSKTLTRKRIANDKIQDFRNFDVLKRYSIDTTPASNILNSALITEAMKSFARDISPIKEASFWSPLALSKDDQEDVHYFFSIDMGKILKQKTRYGHLFAEGQLERAMGHVRISSMKISRRRVSKLNILNKLGVPVSAEFVFDPNEPAEMLAMVGESYPGSLKDAEDSFREVEIHPSIAGVRHFTGTDSSIQDITYGHYRYEVELKILDATAQFFQGGVSRLIRERNTLKKYHNETLMLENYDPIRNKFKQHFKSNRTWIEPIARALATYVVSYNYLRKDGAADKLSATQSYQLGIMVSSGTGTPDSVGAVLDLFDNLIDTYSNILGYSMGEAFATGMDPAALALPAQRTQRPPRLAAIHLEHHFNEVWDSDIPKNYGYNYLALTPSPLPGINVMSGVSFADRVEMEVAKFYLRGTDVQIANGEVDLGIYSVDENRFSHLSPAAIAVGSGGTISTMGNMALNTNNNNRILSAILAMRTSFNSPFNSDGRDLRLTQTAADGGGMFNLQDDAGLDMGDQSGMVITATSNVNRLVGAAETSQLANAIIANCGDSNIDPDLSAATEEGRLTSGERVEEGELQQGVAAQATAMTSGEGALILHINRDAIELATGMEGTAATAPRGRLGVAQALSTFDALVRYQEGIRGGTEVELERARASTATARGSGRRRTIVVRDIQQLPHQVIAQVAGNDSRVAEATLNADGAVDPNLAAETFATMILNFRTLGELQYFEGFEGNGENIFMNEPRFQTLDRVRLIANAGKRIFCRIVRYENRRLGILEPKGLVMPIYDRYFLLDVLESLSGLPVNIATGTAGGTGIRLREEVIMANEVSRFTGVLNQARNIDPALTTSANLELQNNMDQQAEDIDRGFRWHLLAQREREQEMEDDRAVQRRCADELGIRYVEHDGMPDLDYCALIGPQTRARYLAEIRAGRPDTIPFIPPGGD